MRILPVALALLLVAACGKSPTEPDPITSPLCANPAPLLNANNRAFPDRVVDEYLVLLREGSNVNAESARLAARYGFTVQETFTITPSFVAMLDPGVVARLRCETLVQTVEFSRTNIPPP